MIQNQSNEEEEKIVESSVEENSETKITESGEITETENEMKLSQNENKEKFNQNFENDNITNNENLVGHSEVNNKSGIINNTNNNDNDNNNNHNDNNNDSIKYTGTRYEEFKNFNNNEIDAISIILKNLSPARCVELLARLQFFYKNRVTSPAVS